MLDGSNISHAPALDSDESVERKYLFLYPDIATPAIKEIESGTFPKERLTGYFQLMQMGLKVAISDSQWRGPTDRKSTRLNSSHVAISYAVFCLKKKLNKSKSTLYYKFEMSSCIKIARLAN